MYLFETIIILLFGCNVAYSRLHIDAGPKAEDDVKATQSSENDIVPAAQLFTQKLDHFTPSDTREWKQRYYVNDTFFDHKEGIVFIKIAGEGQADPRWLVEGTWIQYAEKFKALCLYLEHRFYGDSQPTGNLKTESLRYLSSQQALADVANFITEMNKQYKFNTTTIKWVTFGGSYPGSLAAWMRLKYPHLVYASVASSATLLAKLEYKGYLQLVQESFQEITGNADCTNNIKAAHKQLEALIKSTPEVVEKDFKLCQPFSKASSDDKNYFFNNIADYFSEVVQYNEDNRLGVKDTLRNLTIKSVCDIYDTNKKNPYQALVNFVHIILDIYNHDCLAYNYKDMITKMQNTTASKRVESRQWLYQTCTEFGFYQTPTNALEMFGNYFNLNYLVKQCQDVFGSKFDENLVSSAVAATNIEYGGLNIKANRVVFVHGSIDPWHLLGITKTRSPDMPAVFVKGTAHCADSYKARPEDSTEIVKARVRIQSYLEKWLTNTN